MEMNPSTALTKLGVGWWKLTGLFEVSFGRFVSIRIRKIEVDYDMVLRDLYVMFLGRVNVRQLRIYNLTWFGGELLTLLIGPN